MKVLEGEGDFSIRYEGRTLVVECVFAVMASPEVLARNAQAAAAGPKLCMVCGTVDRAGMETKTKTFINTDEDEMVVATRFVEMKPKPKSVTVGIVDLKDAKQIWKKLQHVKGN
jgi:hypothetical protein